MGGIRALPPRPMARGAGESSTLVRRGGGLAPPETEYDPGGYQERQDRYPDQDSAYDRQHQDRDDDADEEHQRSESDRAKSGDIDPVHFAGRGPVRLPHVVLPVGFTAAAGRGNDFRLKARTFRST
jgi:hypothetical protein